MTGIRTTPFKANQLKVDEKTTCIPLDNNTYPEKGEPAEVGTGRLEIRRYNTEPGETTRSPVGCAKKV